MSLCSAHISLEKEERATEFVQNGIEYNHRHDRKPGRFWIRQAQVPGGTT